MTEREVVTADKSVPAPKPKEEAKEVEKQRAAAPAADDAKKLKDQAPAAALSARSAQARRDENAAAGALDSVSSEIRTFGGKSFRKKNGIWYDSAYAGQSTKKVKRSADDYKKLDGGLRSIADRLGGTVVIVWNGKAYKIQ
jgi:outer membrane biosynthesis protein TonB